MTAPGAAELAGDRADRLRALAEHLAPDLALELGRLLGLDAEVEQLAADLAETRRQHRTATIMVGELRQRAVQAETRLEDLGADQIRRARAVAHMLGEGWVRVTCLGRGRYATEQVATDRVLLREPL